MSERARAGRAAEGLARRHLEAHGLRLRNANFRCRWGELDLVMQSPEGTVVFVEVRYRARADYGGAAGSIDAAKRRRLVRAAGTWLARHGHAHSPSRFDVVAIDGDNRVDWIVGAFDAA